jgi:N-methylhydantoinase A/oxoprolinase/acetone carboxylase beta subunit
MRHRGQINEVEVMLATPRLKGRFEQPLLERFYRRYEQLYGKGAAYRSARLEIVTLRVRATAPTPRPKLTKAVRLSAAIPKAAKRPARDVYWTDLKKVVKTPIFDGALLASGNRISGPCVVETAQTNVVVHPGRTLRVDAYGNFEIAFK